MVENNENNNEIVNDLNITVSVKNKEWKPKTELGRLVASGKIKTIDDVLSLGKHILEPEIVDYLVPNLKVELLYIGQSKGKFGGGKRRAFRQTQKKTEEGNKPHFATMAVVGNGDGIIGLGYGKAKETVPAREKAIRNAKLNIISIKRGCGSWVCGCAEPHSIPFKVRGKSGSVEIVLMPAPKGTGLKVEKECQKVLSLAGIKDVWSKSFGQTRTKFNLLKACFNALRNLNNYRVNPEHINALGITSGSITKQSSELEGSEKLEDSEKSKT